jgi:hypothetical protein
LNWRLQAKPLDIAGTGSAWECIILFILFASSSLFCWLAACIRGLDVGPLGMNFIVSSSLGLYLRLDPAWGYDSILFFQLLALVASYQLRF